MTKPGDKWLAVIGGRPTLSAHVFSPDEIKRFGQALDLLAEKIFPYLQPSGEQQSRRIALEDLSRRLWFQAVDKAIRVDNAKELATYGKISKHARALQKLLVIHPGASIRDHEELFNMPRLPVITRDSRFKWVLHQLAQLEDEIKAKPQTRGKSHANICAVKLFLSLRRETGHSKRKLLYDVIVEFLHAAGVRGVDVDGVKKAVERANVDDDRYSAKVLDYHLRCLDEYQNRPR